jgi:transcriptional regulator with XRE-family HTH domain
VAAKIKRGIYFLRAWREYLGLSLKDAAELLGVDQSTISYNEGARYAPQQPLIERIAQAFDIPILQLLPKPGSDDSPHPLFDSARKTGTTKNAVASTRPQSARKSNEKPKAEPRTVTEPFTPAGTIYPDAILEHMKARKSPLLAWRLYRGLTIKELADAYGGRPDNIETMEKRTWLRAAAASKLCAILKCKPEQLLRPQAPTVDDNRPPPPDAPSIPEKLAADSITGSAVP